MVYTDTEMDKESIPVPLYFRVKKDLKEKIIGSKFKAGDKLPSESELCVEYNISRITAVRTLKELVNEGWVYRKQGKGSFVRNISVLKSFDIVIEKKAFHSHSFYWDVIRGIEEVASENGMSVIVNTYDVDASNCPWDKIVKSVMNKQFSGKIIIMPSDEKKMDTFLKEKRPFVVIGNYPQNPELYTIGVDVHNGAFQMTEYLISKGHDKIALVGGMHSKIPLGTDFLRGYREALASHNILIREDWIMESEWLEEEGYKLTKRVLQLKERPTAIFAGDDTIAVGIIKALKETNIKIPDEIVVVGFNDLDLATIVSPNLTTMKVPRTDMGMAACNILLKLAHDEEILQKQVILNTELVIRDSG